MNPPPLILGHLGLLACPACGGDLAVRDRALRCSAGGHAFAFENGIPLLFQPHVAPSDARDVTGAIRAFYDGNPFPDYEDVDSPHSLQEKARRSVFARLLGEQIRHNARVLEVGCGTGQLSVYLATWWGRAVFATDLSLGALRLGRDFARRHHVDNVAFLQMNLFRPAFRNGVFDVVVCNGVLHHTSDPFAGFRRVAALVKEGGVLLVGLYNRFGRARVAVRRVLMRIGGRRVRFLDPRLRSRDLTETRKRRWFMDQYRNPHESSHTIGEVLQWFDEAGITFLTGIPASRAAERFSPEGRLFEPHPRGTRLDHLRVQLRMFLRPGVDGGLFMMIGRKGQGR